MLVTGNIYTVGAHLIIDKLLVLITEVLKDLEYDMIPIDILYNILDLILEEINYSIGQDLVVDYSFYDPLDGPCPVVITADRDSERFDLL